MRKEHIHRYIDKWGKSIYIEKVEDRKYCNITVKEIAQGLKSFVLFVFVSGTHLAGIKAFSSILMNHSWSGECLGVTYGVSGIETVDHMQDKCPTQYYNSSLNWRFYWGKILTEFFLRDHFRWGFEGKEIKWC